MHTHQTVRRILLAALLLLAIVGLLPTVRGLSLEEILTYTPASPLLAALVLAVLYTVKSLVCAIPMTVLYLCAGILFPPAGAVLVTYLGLVLEITLGYWIGRSMGSGHAAAFMKKHGRVGALLRSIDRNSGTVICVVRMVPGPLPFDVMSWLFGASGQRFSHYLLYSLIGVSPAMLPWVLAGGGISNPLSLRFLLPFAVGAAVAFTALLLLRRMEKRCPPEPSVTG